MRILSFLFTLWLLYLLYRYIIRPLFVLFSIWNQPVDQEPEHPRSSYPEDESFTVSEAEDAEFEEVD